MKVFVAATPFSIPKFKFKLYFVFLTILESELLTIEIEFLKNLALDSNKLQVSAVSPDCEINIYRTFELFLWK